VDESDWQAAAGALANGQLTLLSLWGEKGFTHMALLGNDSHDIAVLSIECADGKYPSVGKVHAPAIRPERTLRDLFGTEPVGLPDTRAWVDHGRWELRHPLGDAREGTGGQDTYRFLPATGEGLHQIPVGPVHAGIIEPGHFRFTASGETIVRLEARLGYVHKGIEKLMHGADLDYASKLAGRASGDSTVAYAIAFARAVEAALDVHVPPRAHWIRALMAELERIANHLGDFGAVCNDAAFALLHAHCGALREGVLRTTYDCFGHRLMRDCVVPGGVAADILHAAIPALRNLIATLRKRFPALVELYDNTASLQDRTVRTGILQPALARQFGAGGFVGRASGRPFDSRRTPGYPPYDELRFEVPVLEEGDVNARVWIRIRETEQSLLIIEQIISALPDGPVRVEIAAPAGLREGMALAEAFRGDVLAWLRIGSDGRIARCHLRDASVFQWPLLEAAIDGNIVADFPLCNKSFNCSYSGHDL
jgi:Ni,Fe-hydrogenase III large subunit